MTRKKRENTGATDTTGGAFFACLVAPGGDASASQKPAKRAKTAAAPESPDPMGDLLAAEAIIDLLRLGIESDFMAGEVEARQDSGAVAACHALYLVRRARLSVTEALANQHVMAIR